MTNKICIYAICKNESQFVEQWLASMSEADYIVVLDTGSEDDTFEKLKNDPRVYRAEQKIITPWRFDVARNESMKLIPADANILVCTDLDELLEPGWADVLREKWIDGVHTRAVYKYAWSHDEDGAPSRIFQYDKIHSTEWTWNFPVHECLVRKDDILNCEYTNDRTLMVFDEVYLHHYPDPTKSRGSYLPLLEQRKAENPTDYYGRIYLAHEYYYRGHYQKSINELEEILRDYADRYNTIEQASCYLFMGDAYRALDNHAMSIAAYQSAILLDNSYREPYINLALVLNELGYYHQAIGTINECLNKTFRHYNWLERGTTWTYEPYDILAVAYYWIGDYDSSLVNAYKALRYAPNDERLLNNLQLIEDKIN
jgi:tetratricopeptide (TPR) repeat protein